MGENIQVYEKIIKWRVWNIYLGKFILKIIFQNDGRKYDGEYICD